MDRITIEERSKLMSKIRSKNTTPEWVMFLALKSAGLKFKRHYKILGNPYIAFLKQRVLIFIDGDFWHGGRDFKKREHRLPEYWVNKIKRNIKRDRHYRTKLKEDGWIVIRIWESKILKNPSRQIGRILNLLFS